jgi:hypothetical protein
MSTIKEELQNKILSEWMEIYYPDYNSLYDLEYLEGTNFVKKIKSLIGISIRQTQEAKL